MPTTTIVQSKKVIFQPLWLVGQGNEEIGTLIQNYIREVEELR